MCYHSDGSSLTDLIALFFFIDSSHIPGQSELSWPIPWIFGTLFIGSSESVTVKNRLITQLLLLKIGIFSNMEMLINHRIMLFVFDYG